MRTARFTVLGPLMGGPGSQAFLGQEVGATGPVRPVVMVFLPDEVVDNSELFVKILDETKVAVRIDHPNVIALHGLAKLDEGYARIVEFADAESLRSMFRRLKNHGRKMPPSIATAVMSGACMGVHYAHELGQSMTGKAMIHGGLRPETLLISFQGQPKVTGFGAGLIAEGLARAHGAESSIRDSYTAPEQIFGGRKAATVHTDVYALGAVLYEALTAKPPFGQDASLAQAITTAEPGEKLLADVPEALARIVLRAMSKESTQRFNSALEMRQALVDSADIASAADVAGFMDWLFPADSPQRMARRELLAKSHPGDEVPETQLQTGSGEFSAVGPLPTPAGIAAQTPGLPAPPSSQVAPPSSQVAPPSSQVAPPSSQVAPPSLQTVPPSSAHPAPQIVHEERVVYRTHPAVYALVGLVGGAVIVLAAIYALRTPQPSSGHTVNNPALPAAPSATQAAAARPPASPDAGQPPAPVAATKPAVAPILPSPVARPRKPSRLKKRNPVLRPRKPALGGTGVLIIQAPAGSTISVDGKRRGTAPIGEMELSAGRHKVVVEQASTGIRYRRTVKVKRDLDLTLTVGFHNE